MVLIKELWKLKLEAADSKSPMHWIISHNYYWYCKCMQQDLSQAWTLELFWYVFSESSKYADWLKRKGKESKQIDLSLAFSSCNAKLTVSCVTGEKSPASFNTCIKWPHGMRWDLYESWQNSYGHSWSRHLEYQWHSPVSSFIYADEYVSFVFSHVKK